MRYDKIRLEQRGRVALLTLDNPAEMNAMDDQMGPQMLHALERVARAGQATALVLAGAGGVFCAGGNLKRAWAALGDGPGGAGEVFLGYTAWVHQAVDALLRMPQVVIAAVDGPASGAGLAWILASDLAVAAEDARIVPGFLGVGLTPAAGVTRLLPLAMGLGRASEMLLLNRPLAASRALELGLLTAVAPPGQALDLALDLAQRLADGPAEALAASKALLNRQRLAGLCDHMQAERQQTAIAADSVDFRRLMNRFFNRTQRDAGE